MPQEIEMAERGFGDDDSHSSSDEEQQPLDETFQDEYGGFHSMSLTSMAIRTTQRRGLFLIVFLILSVAIFTTKSFLGKGVIEPPSGAQSSTSPGDDPNDQDNEQQKSIDEWLRAKVTLADGEKYTVVDQLHHDTDSFTEGLTYAHGRLLESAGLNDVSSIRELDPHTGETMQSWKVHSVFAEGLTYVESTGKLVQLTYKAKAGIVYDFDSMARQRVFNYVTTTGEGWGLTYMPETNELVLSDGSDYLLFWDPVSFNETRRVKVRRQEGVSAKQINELEYWRGRILANVWFQDIIIVINPETGIVEKEYDFSNLYPKSERAPRGADVLNGISVSEDPDALYVTGKRWDRMFKIKLGY